VSCCDIIFCQEHWLTPDLLFKIDAVASDFTCFNISAMDNAVSSRVLSGRPFGGLSILVHKRYAAKAKLITADSRYVNVYLLCRDNSDVYKSAMIDILCAVGQVLDQNCNHNVIIAGDFNFEFSDELWRFRILKEFFLMNTALPLVSCRATVPLVIVTAMNLYSAFH